MLDKLLKDLEILRDAYSEGDYQLVVKKSADLLINVGNFVKQATELFSSLVLPTKFGKKTFSVPSAEDCERAELYCANLKAAVLAPRKGNDKDEKELDPATILAIIELIAKGIELIKRWRENRRK